MLSRPWFWESQTEGERIEYLGRLANEVAARDGRGEVQLTSGRLSGNNDDASLFVINSNYIHQNEPYNAVESVFHQSSVAQQRHISEHPELAESPEQHKQIQDNQIAYEHNDAMVHHMQPIERQARQDARAEMEQMFGMGDSAYEQHRASRDARNAEWDADAADHVNTQPQFQEFSGTAQDKVNQYIAQQADRIRQQSQTTPETVQDTAHDQSSSPQQEEEQAQQHSRGRSR